MQILLPNLDICRLFVKAKTLRTVVAFDELHSLGYEAYQERVVNLFVQFARADGGTACHGTS